MSDLEPATSSAGSIHSSVLDDDSDMSQDGDSDAQKQWDENIQQLERAVFNVLCPVIGRVLGTRFALKMWIRWVNYRWQTVGQYMAETS